MENWTRLLLCGIYRGDQDIRTFLSSLKVSASFSLPTEVEELFLAGYEKEIPAGLVTSTVHHPAVLIVMASFLEGSLLMVNNLNFQQKIAVI